MRRTWIVALAVLLALLVLAPFAVRAAGTWLVVEDAEQPAMAAVVFGGQLPFRAMEAAALYRRKMAREVWLTRGGVYKEDTALANLGIAYTPEHVYSQRVLERLDVPVDAIRVLPGTTQSSAEEIRAIARELQARGGERVILVTSKYHTRRLKVLWRKLVGATPEAIVRYTPDDPYEPTEWFRNSIDIRSVWREWFGLLNAWAGFPISSERW